MFVNNGDGYKDFTILLPPTTGNWHKFCCSFVCVNMIRSEGAEVMSAAFTFNRPPQVGFRGNCTKCHFSPWKQCLLHRAWAEYKVAEGLSCMPASQKFEHTSFDYRSKFVAAVMKAVYKVLRNLQDKQIDNTEIEIQGNRITQM